MGQEVDMEKRRGYPNIDRGFHLKRQLVAYRLQKLFIYLIYSIKLRKLANKTLNEN